MPDEDIVTDDAIDGEEQTSQTEEPNVQTLQAQKTHWREKAKKLESELATVKTQIPKPTEPAPIETKQDDSDWKRKIEFTVSHKEYDSEDINKLLTLSKGLGVDLEKAKEDPMFKAYYNAKQEQLAKEGTTPVSGRSPKVAPPKPIEQMSREEHEAYFKSRIKS